MSRFHGRLFDFGGSILTFVGVTVLALGALQLLAIAYINSQWAPVPLREIQAEAVARSSAALSRIDAPNVMLQVGASTVEKWLQPELQMAVKKLNESQPNMRLQIDAIKFSFEGQRGAISSDFELHLRDRNITLSGTVEGIAYVALDGRTLSVRPALSKLKLNSVRSESKQSWWLPSLARLLFAELLLVRGNINGQLSTYTEQLQIAPLTQPGEPRPNVPITFADPFQPGKTITRTFVPPVLKGAALLANGNQAIVLGQLSLDDVAAPNQSGRGNDDFLVLRREFQYKSKAAGLTDDSSQGVSFQISPTFIEDLFRRFAGQTFTRDRVNAAVQASFEALPKLKNPNVGVSLDTSVVTKIVDGRLKTALKEWALNNSGRIINSTFEVRPQHLWAEASASFEIVSARAHLEAKVVVAVPVAGASTGIRLFPAIDQLSITKLNADSLGDLTGLLRGINVFLAGAVGAANSVLQPEDVGLTPLRLGTIDFSTVGSSTISISPQTYAPPAMAISNTALLLDENRILVMAETSPVTATRTSSMDSDFETYRRAFHARWREPFGDPVLPGVAHAYVKTSTVARYINDAVNGAHLALTASMPLGGKSVTPLEVGEIPSVNCKRLLNCPSCKSWELWCWPVKLACEAANASTNAACRLALEPARWAVNEMTRILGRHLGDLETEARGNASLHARDFQIELTDDFANVGVKATVAADATASADLRFNSKSVSGAIVCPLDFRHHVPFPSGEIHAQIPPQQLELRSSIRWELKTMSDGGERFGVLITPQDDIPINGNLDTQPYLQLRLVMLSMNVQCPVTNVINVLVPGLGTALGLLDIGQITALITDSVARDVLNGLPPDVRALYLGKIERKLEKPGPMNFGFDIPVVHVGDVTLQLHPAIKDGLIQLHPIAQ